jgi:hypothetical protein
MVSPWPRRDVLHRNLEFFGQKKTEAGRIQHAGHADHAVMREARRLAHHPNHNVQRIGDDDDEGVRTVGAQSLAHVADDFGVDADQIVAAHARLARHARGDDRHIGASDVGIVAGAAQRRIEAFDRRCLRQIQTLTLRHAVDNIE